MRGDGWPARADRRRVEEVAFPAVLAQHVLKSNVLKGWRGSRIRLGVRRGWAVRVVVEGDLHALFVNGLLVDVAIRYVMDHAASPTLRLQSDPYVGLVHDDVLKGDV